MPKFKFRNMLSRIRFALWNFRLNRVSRRIRGYNRKIRCIDEKTALLVDDLKKAGVLVTEYDIVKGGNSDESSRVQKIIKIHVK